MTVMLEPVPGCMRTAGVADQQGITWPAFYKWEMRRVDGSWMLEQMTPEPPPIDVPAEPVGTPLLASE